MKRFIIIFSAVLIALLVIAFLALQLIVTGERVANYANEALGDEFRVEIHSASLNPITRTLHLDGVTVLLQANGPEIFNADQIRAERIGIIESFRGNVSVGLFSFQNYFFNQELFAEHEPFQNGGDGGDQTVFSIDSIELLNGSIRFAANDGELGNIHGLHIRTGALNYDPSIHDADFSRIQNVEIEISEMDFNFWDGRYTVKADSILIDEPNSILKIGSMNLDTPLEEDEFYESLQYRTDLFRFDLNGFLIEGLDFSALLEERFVATSITLDTLDLHVSMHKAVPGDPEKPPQPMPLDALNNLPFEIAIDTINTHHADIRYSEYDEEGVRPGTIHFANIDGEFINVHSNSAEPIVFTAQSYLEETGELHVEFKFSMENAHSITEITGTLGRFEVSRLNNIFKDLEGIQINDGIIHSVYFNFVLRNEESAGSIAISYDNFEMEFIDMVDHEQGFGDRILSFLVDDITLRSSTMNNNGDSRTGEISEEREPDQSFFNYLWKSLRSGILEIIRRI